VYIQPSNEDELYKYLSRYFDGKYIPWESAKIHFLLNGTSVGKPTCLDYKIDNLFSASKLIYNDYVNGRIWSVDLSNVAKSK
jgi:hypothetical protein